MRKVPAPIPPRRLLSGIFFHILFTVSLPVFFASGSILHVFTMPSIHTAASFFSSHLLTYSTVDVCTHVEIVKEIEMAWR